MGKSVKGDPVLVDVYAHPPGSPEDYTIDWKFQGGPSQGNTPIVLPKGSGSHDLTFTLHDNSGKGLAFKPKAEDAMWIGHGKGCPTGKGNGKGQIVHGTVANGTTLTVIDDNSGNPATLHYMLRFDPDPNVFDPEIRNGGGGKTYTRAATAVVGAVVGALVVSGVQANDTSMTVVGALAGAAVGYLVGTVIENSLGSSEVAGPG